MSKNNKNKNSSDKPVQKKFINYRATDDVININCLTMLKNTMKEIDPIWHDTFFNVDNITTSYNKFGLEPMLQYFIAPYHSGDVNFSLSAEEFVDKEYNWKSTLEQFKKIEGYFFNNRHLALTLDPEVNEKCMQIYQQFMNKLFEDFRVAFRGCDKSEVEFYSKLHDFFIRIEYKWSVGNPSVYPW